MSDRLDKELSGHIRAVFDAYEEAYDPVNWQRLQRKRQGRIWKLYLKRAAAAASVAIFLAAGVLLWNRQSPGNEGLLTENGRFVEAPPAGAPGNPATSTAHPAVPEENPSLSPGESAPASRQAAPKGETAPDYAQAEPAAGSLVDANETVAASPAASETFPQKAPGALAGGLPGERETESDDPGNDSGERLAAATETPSDSRAVSGAEQSLTRASGEVLAEKKARQGRFSIGFVTTSLMNYANGNTANEVHFGAGITSGWKLSDRLSVHSGLILAENSLSLNSSNSSVQSSNYSLARAESTDVLSEVGKANIVQNVSPTSMDVSLLVVDIPLNLTYRVGMGNTDLLLTGGLSSFAYLDQEYSYHNTVRLYTNATVDAPEPVVREEKAFSHFDLARQLNLAIGTEVPLGKGSVLIVEPYVKYPLGSLTSEQIRFGSAGMNLRLSFGSK